MNIYVNIYFYTRAHTKLTAKINLGPINLFFVYVTFPKLLSGKDWKKALEALSNKHIPEISIQFSEMEIALNEIDRARAILAHGSQVCDPRIKKSFWQHWKNFEVQHGNEETFKEMLRIQRSVKASYLSSHYLENPDEMDDSEDVNDNFNSNNNNDNIQLNSNNGVGVELNPELNPNMMMST